MLGVARKLKQLWILSETKENEGEGMTDVDNRLNVNDVAREISEKLRRETSPVGEGEEMDDVQLENPVKDDEHNM